MPKKIKYNLRTPNARRSIPAGTKLHTEPQATPKLYLGYRKSPTLGGVWFALKHREGRTDYDRHRIGLADDTSEANNATFFSHEQACQAAQQWFQRQTGAIIVKKSYTVADLMAEYLADREANNCKSLHKIRQTTKTHILPVFGDTPLRKLTHHQVESWFQQLANTPPRIRASAGKEATLRMVEISDGSQRKEYERRRKATANRIFNLFRAALNFGYKKHRIANRQAWDKISAFDTVNKPRIVEMTIDEARKLVECCDPDFRQLAEGALFTGCRYSELTNLRVENFSFRHAHIFIEQSKNGHSRFIPLSDEGLEFFRQLTQDRQPGEFVFLKADGPRWTESLQKRRIAKALKTAGIDKPFTFHQLRHAFASLSLESGMRLEEVGTVLGHLDLKITSRFYARFSESHLLGKVRQHAPRLRPDVPQSDPDNATRVIPFPMAADA